MKYFFLRCLVALASVLSVGVSAHGQNLSWTVDILDHYTTNVTGQDTGQPGIASAFFNNEVWVAYLDSTTCVGNECNIQLGNNGGGWLNFINKSYITINSTVITANANPALSVYNGVMYLAYTGASNSNYVIATADGQHWTQPLQVAAGFSTWYSPSIAAGPNSPYVFLGFMSGTTKTPIICTVLYAANALTLNACNNLTTMPTINYNPSLVFWGDYLYIGYSASSGNCLSFYRGNADSIAAATASNINQVAGAWNPWTTNCAVQTNATPSLAVFQNGSLYIGYRANNNGKDFSVASVTTQGVATEEVMNYGMQGPASLLWVTYSAPDTTPAAPYLANFYTYEGGLYYSWAE
jgi:hypothetical protein